MITEELVHLMTERIIDKFSPEKVIVFGSWARGEAYSQSDLDFLVVMPYVGSKRDAQVSCGKISIVTLTYPSSLQ